MGSLESAGHDGLIGLVEVDIGHAHASPSTLNGREDVGLIGYEGGLLVESEFENAASFFLAGESGEDLVVEAKVGVVHMRAFDDSWEHEGETAEESDFRCFGHLDSSHWTCRGYPPIARV